MSGRVLVIGASRGIGLGLVDRHLADGWEVHATTRDGAAPRPGAVPHRLDVLDADQLMDLIARLERPVDRLIHNAGILGEPAELMMRVNAEAPIRVVQALLDAGRVAAGGQVAIMTSQMGARRGRTRSLGGYGDSKAALNDEFRRRADGWAEHGVTAVVIHPGWVRTDMGGAAASISVEESADGVTHLLDTLTPSMHAGFWTWDGRRHEW